jgi:hypothetical protein
MDTKRRRISRISIRRHVRLVDASNRGHRIAKDVKRGAGTTDKREKRERRSLGERTKTGVRCAESASNRVMR